MAASTKFKQPPPINYSSKGAIACKAICIDPENGVYLMAASGTPVDGTAGTGAGFAGPGSLYIDIATPKIYINGGTKLSPVWKIVTSA